MTTSLEYKDEIGKRLLQRQNEVGRQILVQKKNESQNPLTVDIFKRDGHAMLVGSGSYYTGFSVPGKALQALVISKLPFPVRSEPLFTIKIDEINSSKSTDKETKINDLKYFLMFTKLEQGIGRLIRSTTDYGTLVVTDPRVISDNRVRKWFEERDISLHNDYSEMKNFYDNWEAHNVVINAEEYVRSELFEDRVRKNNKR